MRVIVYITGLGAICLLAGGLTLGLVKAQDFSGETNPEVTVRPPVSTTPGPDETILPICPPKPLLSQSPMKLRNIKKDGYKKNLLIVSTLDGQISALDLDKDGEMFWSVSTFPGSMLVSSISSMDMDNRGQYVKLIPSLTGRLYKFNGEMVEPIPIDVDTLLGSSLRMQENMVVTGGKESRTYGIHKDTGEILYECSMNDCTNFQENNTDDILVVQRNTQTVRAHTPRSGAQKWNFSVSLHDLAYHPATDPCQEEEQEEEEDILDQAAEDYEIKTVVPEGIICATTATDDNLIKWKRKFITPIVDVWKLKNGKLVKVNLFSKNHIPKRNVLLDDDDDISDDENPSLYIGKHNNQLYIQESVNIRREADSVLNEYTLNPASTDVMYPRVSWKPYLVSPSRTPVINHGSSTPELHLLSFDQKRGDAKTTALAITSQNAEYPYDAGFYLYPDTTPLDGSDVIANITALRNPGKQAEQEGESLGESPVEFIYLGLWHWWKEVIFISLVTAVMMNVLITRPIIHRMRDGFQEASRTLVQQVQHIQNEQAVKEVVREVFVEVPVNVPSYTSIPATPSTGTSHGSSGPDFSSYERQSSEFSSRYLTDFEPVQCLGRGGFGVVFESKNKYDDIHYAVKRITLPSSEENKKKVMREVKLHAKLDHRNIVRYYSTWLETPPLGWQEQADAWFDEADLGTGPTPFDPTSTDYSLSNVNHQGKKPSEGNPLKFQGYGSSGFNSFSRGDYTAADSESKADISFSNNCDNSYSIRFEDTNSQGEGSRTEEEDSDDEAEGESEEDAGFLNEESTGGILFTSDTQEIKGTSEGVCLDIETSNSGPVIQFKSNTGSSSESLSCCDALEWDENHSKESQGPEKKKAKSYLYIVMQLCKKETLRDWLRNNRVREERQVLSIFCQICVGVEYVHRQGLIHRDLKPSNIYIAHDGTIKIGDFGLLTGPAADVIGPMGDQTNRHNSEDQLTDQVGTQLYMSPEQLNQKPYNHKVDIFSLGLIFLELCVAFSTQMERLRELSNVKKGKYPSQLEQKTEYTSLLGLMLNVRPEVRPEIVDILQLPWLQGVRELDTPRRRINTLTESSVDLSSEELLDN